MRKNYNRKRKILLVVKGAEIVLVKVIKLRSVIAVDDFFLPLSGLEVIAAPLALFQEFRLCVVLLHVRIEFVLLHLFLEGIMEGDNHHVPEKRKEEREKGEYPAVCHDAGGRDEENEEIVHAQQNGDDERNDPEESLP